MTKIIYTNEGIPLITQKIIEEFEEHLKTVFKRPQTMAEGSIDHYNQLMKKLRSSNDDMATFLVRQYRKKSGENIEGALGYYHGFLDFYALLSRQTSSSQLEEMFNFNKNEK